MEGAAWIAGALLLGTAVGVHIWSIQASAAGVAALRQAQLASAVVPLPHPAQGAGSSLPGSHASWSESRLVAYRHALATDVTPEAVLRIPALDLEVPVYDGTSEWNLNRGAGWIEGTAPIGSQGNVGIAAHRDGFFRSLKDIRIGDHLYLETLETRYDYRVTDLRVVSPRAVEVLNNTSRPSVTLVTCFPFYYVGAAPRRFIVRAEPLENP